MFTLVVQNEQTHSLKTLLNNLAYLFTTSKHMKHIISILVKSSPSGEASARNLEVLLQSQSFKTLYFAKVRSSNKYKSSFEQYFDKYLDKFTRNGDKHCQEVLVKQLT